jgi:hypothetical protein
MGRVTVNRRIGARRNGDVDHAATSAGRPAGCFPNIIRPRARARGRPFKAAVPVRAESDIASEAEADAFDTRFTGSAWIAILCGPSSAAGRARKGGEEAQDRESLKRLAAHIPTIMSSVRPDVRS